MINVQLSLVIVVLSLIFTGHAVQHRIRILGGTPSEPGKFPFYVSIRILESNFCGGSIIDRQWILTAAHCCENFKRYIDLINVAAGRYDTTTTKNKGHIYKVSNIIQHPNYFLNDTKVANDICLLKLKKPIRRQTKTIRIIQLERQFVDIKRDVQIMGFGDTDSNGTVSQTLDWLSMKTIPFKDCVKIWQQHQPNTVEKSEICAIAHKGEGVCHGDSGGGLIYFDKLTNKPILIGVVSWGIPCAKGLPDVFTRVSSFIDWIDSNIKIH